MSQPDPPKVAVPATLDADASGRLMPEPVAAKDYPKTEKQLRERDERIADLEDQIACLKSELELETIENFEMTRNALFEATQQNLVLEARVAQLVEALIWCSGSQDFQTEGIARVGWEKLCVPLLSAPPIPTTGVLRLVRAAFWLQKMRKLMASGSDGAYHAHGAELEEALLEFDGACDALDPAIKAAIAIQ